MLRDGTRNLGPPFTYSHVTMVSFKRNLPFQATHVYNHLVSSTFNSPLGVLFSFPSPYYCTIGLRTYLVLEVGISRLPKPKSRLGTLEHPSNSCWLMPTGLSPSAADLSRSLWLNQRGGDGVRNPTSPIGFPTGFGLNYSHFARRY